MNAPKLWPLPWSVKRTCLSRSQTRVEILDATGQRFSGTIDEDAAAFIVHSVNVHNDLVQTLVGLMDRSIQYDGQDVVFRFNSQQEAMITIAAMRSLLTGVAALKSEAEGRG